MVGNTEVTEWPGVVSVLPVIRPEQKVAAGEATER